LKVTLASLTR